MQAGQEATHLQLTRATKGSLSVPATEGLVFLQNYYNVPASRLFERRLFKHRRLLQQQQKKGGRVNEVQEESEKLSVLETFNHQKQEG